MTIQRSERYEQLVREGQAQFREDSDKLARIFRDVAKTLLARGDLTNAEVDKFLISGEYNILVLAIAKLKV